MIAAWMVYCLLCALGLSLAAALAERALLRGRGPVRHVWATAMVLSLLVPVVAFRFAPRLAPMAAPAEISLDVMPGQDLRATVTVLASPMADLARPASPNRNWLPALARLDRPLAVGWVGLSLAVAINLFGGIVVLAVMRRRWQRRTALGVPVFVSERTGPAVVGAVSPAIVLPEWVLALEPRKLSLMLRHEQEHRHAGDGRLLTAAQLALIAMPWNVALWWQLLRLRAAVELDCDARVLQDADARSYADLLLEVARPRRGPRLMGATAFAERATQLERRIRVLSRHRVRTSRAARVVATCTGLLAVTAAWVAPRPPVPARAPAPPVTQGPVVPEPSTPSTPQTIRAANPGEANRSAQVTGKPASLAVTLAEPRPVAPLVVSTDSVTGTSTPAATDSAQSPGTQERSQDVPRLADSAFVRLFDGITLTSEQRTRARAILIDLQQQQYAQDYATAAHQSAQRANRVALEAQRNVALRELLTNEADRATFDQRVAGGMGLRVGGAGRGGNQRTAWLDSAGGGRRGWRVGVDSLAVRGGRGGRGGGGGDSLYLARYRLQGDSARWVTRDRVVGQRDSAVHVAGLRLELLQLAEVTLRLNSILTSVTFESLFDGITLTADQESRARALIDSTRQALQVPTPPRSPVALRIDGTSGIVTMRAPSDSALTALITNETDRATLRSRIVTLPR